MASDKELDIYVRNIACAGRDESRTPFLTRLPLLINDIKDNNPDVVVLLEAGRSSLGMTWTEMAVLIERQTDLVYVGVSYANLSANPFGHAVFVKKGRALIARMTNALTNVSGDARQGQVTEVVVKTSETNCVTIGVVHMPMSIEGRLALVQWLCANSARATMWVGDFNTFPDDIGPDMIEQLKESGLVHLPCDAPFTFKAFPHDTLTVPIKKKRFLHPMSIIVTEDEHSVTVLPVSILDHVFLYKNIIAQCTATFLPHTAASDHSAILIRVVQ